MMCNMNTTHGNAKQLVKDDRQTLEIIIDCSRCVLSPALFPNPLLPLFLSPIFLSPLAPSLWHASIFLHLFRVQKAPNYSSLQIVYNLLPRVCVCVCVHWIRLCVVLFPHMLALSEFIWMLNVVLGLLGSFHSIPYGCRCSMSLVYTAPESHIPHRTIFWLETKAPFTF